MPQLHLPMFPHGVTSITPELAVEKREGQVTYFNGHMPIFLHAEHDVRTFRMITAQFCVNGNVTQMEIVRAFGVSVISVKRAVQRYRTHGPSGFYAPPRRRGAAVLTSARPSSWDRPSILVSPSNLGRLECRPLLTKGHRSKNGQQTLLSR